MSTAASPTRPTDLASRVAVHPSRAVRAVPPFMFSVPAGWELDEAPQALAIVRAPARVDGFVANVVIAHERVPATVDHRQAAQSTWIQLLQACPDATAATERMVTFGDRPTYLRAVQFPAPDTGRPLAQLQALFFAPTATEASVRDLFQVIGTCPPAAADEHAASFLEVIGSFTFT